MAPTIGRERALALATHQTSLLVSTEALATHLAECEVDLEPTEVFDLTGEVLFWRTRLRASARAGWMSPPTTGWVPC